MTRRLIRPDLPVDPVTIEILRAVADVSQAEGIDYILVGATARDVLLTHVFGIAQRRATMDVDFAIAVRDWDQFAAVHARLLARGSFTADRAPQRLYYKGRDGDLVSQLDLVPFGAIADQGNEIAWPPDMKVIMNVAGYDDVLAAAELVAVTPEFDGRVVSLPGLAILKLIAWSDRGRENPRDAHDLIHLMSQYAVAGNFDRVYEEEGVIEVGGYDPDLAGVYLLGRDMRRVASVETLEVLLGIIDDHLERLTMAMVLSNRHLDDVEAWVEQRVQLLRRGLGAPLDDVDR